MKRNFLLMLLLTLLPLVAWAADPHAVSGTLTYDGSAKTVAVSGDTYGYKYRYAITNGTSKPAWSESSTELPTATNAGTYRVYWANRYTTTGAVRESEWNDQNHYFEVIVHKANNSVTSITIEGLQYGAGTPTPSITAANIDGVISYQYSANGTGGWGTYASVVKGDVGTWYVKATIGESANYQEVTSSAYSFEIAKAIVTVTPGNETAKWRNPFLGIPMNLITPTVTGATDWSEAKDYLQWKQVEPIGDAGQGYAYTLESNGTTNAHYEFVVSGNGTVNITKNTTGSIAGGGDPAALTYSGESQALKPASPCAYRDGQNNEAGHVEYRITAPAAAATEWSTSVPEATNADTYVVEVKGVGDVNHEDATSTETYSVLINKATTPLPVVTKVSDEPLTYLATLDESKFEVTKESDGVLSYTYEFKAPDASAFTAKAFDGAAGTWKVYAHQAEGTNWKALDGTTGFEFTVGKAVNEFTTPPVLNDAELVYKEGETKALLKNAAAVATKGGTGTVQYKVDYTSNLGLEVPGSYSTAAPTGENAGTYTIYYKAVEDNNWQGISEEKLGSIVIEKSLVVRSGGPELASADLTYNGANQKLLQDGKYFTGIKGGTVTYYVKGANEAAATEFAKYSEVVKKNADAYTVSYKFFADNSGNYKDDEKETVIGATESATKVIAKKEVILGGMTKTGTIETFYDKTDGKVDGTKPLYTASDFLEDIEILPGDDPKVILPKIVTMTYPAFENLIVGTNGVEFTANDDNNENYKAKVVGGAANLKIEAMPATVTTDPIGVTTVYNALEQSLIATAGVANGGTVVYSLDKDAAPETWTEDIKRTNADDYTVYYSVKPDKFYTYTAAAGDFEAKITPAAVTPATIAAASDLVFEKGLAQPLITVTGETQHGTMMYSWKKTADAVGAYSAWSEQIPAQVNAGSYDVKYYVKADENYESTTDAIISPIVIAPKNLETLTGADKFSLNPASSVYTGENLKSTVEVVTALEKDVDYEVAAPAEMVNVDEYTFTFTGKGNYTGIATATFEITANKAEISNLAIEGWTYGSYDPVKNAPKANTTFGEVTFSYTNENEEALPGVPVDAGTYFVVANVAASANWAAADPVKKSFDIAQKPVTPTAPKAHALTYNGLPQALIDAGSAEGATIQYAYTVGEGAEEPADADYSDAIPEDKNAATYKVYYKFTVDPNYTFGNALEAGSFDVKINPASVTYSLGNQTVDYTGNVATPVENEAYQITNGALMVGDGDAFTFEFTEIDATNANENGVPFTKLKTIWKDENVQNYAIQFNLTGKLFIKKAVVVVTAPKAKEGMAFTDAEKPLIASAATAQFNEVPFKFIYSCNGGADTKDYTQIVGKEAGDYVITWKVDDDSNNFTFVDAEEKPAAEGTITAKILPAQEWDAEVPAFADGDIVKTYNGTDFAKALDPVKFMLSDGNKTLKAVQDYTVEVNGKVLATKDEKNVGKIYDITATEIKNAGDYTVTYKGVANYEGRTAEYLIKVLPKNIKEFADKNFENIPQATGLVYDKKKDNFVEPVVKYNAVEGAEPLTLVKATDKQDNDYTLAVTKAGKEVTEVRNAGDYTYTFEGKGNYTGTKEFFVNIKKAELIVIAPNATKTYDAKTVVEEKEFEELTYSGLQKGDHVDLGELKVADVVTVPANAINVGEYTLTIDVTEFPKQENYEISETNTLPGTLTINPAAPVKISFSKDAKFGKQYSQKDNLNFTAADLVVNEGDGELFDGLAKAAPLLVLSREEGEDVGDYTLNINFATTPKATAEAAATFKKNYEDVTFGTGTFTIVPLEAALKVSIAAASSTYNGKAPQLAWADDLSNMVVTGLPAGKDKAGIFTTLPTITIVDDDDNVVTDATANAGEYNIQLSGGVSKNYTTVAIIGSYYTIEPVAVEADFNTIPVAAVGVPAKEIMDQVTFTVKAVYEEDEATLAANMDKFEAQWTDLAKVADEDGKIKETGDGKNALVIAYTGKEAEANFIIKDAPVYGSLNIGTEGGEIALNDASDVVTYASTGTTVTFSNSRAIPADKWQACVLPCTISIQEFSKAFGYAAIDVLDEERTQGDEIHFSLKVTGNIEAGVPFLFKANGGTKEDPKVDFIKVTLNDVDVASTAKLVEDGVNVVTDPDNNVKFIGTFETVNITTSGYRYISNGKWYNTKDGYAKPYVIRPLRAYLDLTEMTSAADARIFIEEPDGTETAIDAIEFANDINGESIYTVDGKKVSKAAQKGIYIQNGKKIAIK